MPQKGIKRELFVILKIKVIFYVAREAAAHEAGFSQYPAGHCSFPPRLRRFIHENLGELSLRFSVSLRFYTLL